MLKLSALFSKSFTTLPLKLHERNLYSQAALGIEAYRYSRQKTSSQLHNFQEKFKNKMKDYVDNEKSNLIFTEDLKNILMIANKEDVDLVSKMIEKFNENTGEHRFGSFTFGPVVMRMFHYLDLPDEALKCYNRNKNNGFFDQHVSYQILMDLLYNHERYEDVMNIFEVVKEKQLNMTKFPKYVIVLVMASCYKQNSVKSYEYASNLWKEIIDSGSSPIRRACVLFAMLAINQGAPHVAMEVLSNQNQNYITVRSMKTMALADLGRVDDAIEVVRSVLNIDKPDGNTKHTFFQETIERVWEGIRKSNNKDWTNDFTRIERALKERDLLSDKKLDDLLCYEIKLSKPTTPINKAKLHMSYRENREKQSKTMI